MPRTSNDRPRSRANVLDKNAVSLAPFFHGGPPTATERRFKTPPRPSPAKGFPFPRRPYRRVAPLSPSLGRSYRAFRLAFRHRALSRRRFIALASSSSS